jgi:hypothetical protein
VFISNRELKSEYCFSSGSGSFFVIEATTESKHLLDVDFVFSAFVSLVFIKIVIAVRHTKTCLDNLANSEVSILAVRLRTYTKEATCVILGH